MRASLMDAVCHQRTVTVSNVQQSRLFSGSAQIGSRVQRHANAKFTSVANVATRSDDPFQIDAEATPLMLKPTRSPHLSETPSDSSSPSTSSPPSQPTNHDNRGLAVPMYTATAAAPPEPSGRHARDAGYSFQPSGARPTRVPADKRTRGAKTKSNQQYKRLVQGIINDGVTDELEKWNSTMLNFALKDVCVEGDVSLSFELLRWMYNNGRVNEHSLVQLCKGVRCAGGEAAECDNVTRVVQRLMREGVVLQKGRPAEAVATAYVELLVEGKGYTAALDAAEKLYSLGIFCTAEPYNMIIFMCARNYDVHAVMEVFNTMRAHPDNRLQMSKYTYSGVLQALTSCKMWSLGVQLYEKMHEDGVEADEMLYNQLITCCAYTGQVDKALSIFNDMQASGISPNLFVYNSLMNAYSQRGRYTEALQLYHTMVQEHNLQPDTFTFVALFKAGHRSNAQGLDDVQYLMDEMTAHGVLYNEHIVCSIITCYRNAYSTDINLNCQLAETLFRSTYAQGIRGEPATYHSMMSMYRSVGNIDGVMEVYDRMVEAGVQPLEATFNVLLECCSAKGWQQKAEEIQQIKETMAFLSGRGRQRHTRY